MLRVFKPTSPLSVGSFILAPFCGVRRRGARLDVTGWFPRLGRLAGVGAAAFGPPLATYTAALVANTAVPAWHEAHRELPFVFAGSGATAAGGLAMVLAPVDAGRARAADGAGRGRARDRRGRVLTRRLGMLAEPYQQGRSGRLMRTARAMTTVAAVVDAARPAALRVLARGGAGATYVAASVITRFGVFEAGPRVGPRPEVHRRPAEGAARGPEAARAATAPR